MVLPPITVDGISAYVLAIIAAMTGAVGSVLWMNNQVKEVKEEVIAQLQPQIDALEDDLKTEIRGMRADMALHNAAVTARIDSLIQVVLNHA